MLLEQIRNQTTEPREIIVVDQTPPPKRDLRLEADFADLPLKLIQMDRQGQSSARNLGFQHATGDYVLLLDDDVEIHTTLIEDHLANLARSRADASCGVSRETGALPLPASFRRRRVSDVFPAGNSLLNLHVAFAIGGFDPTFDGGQCEDHEFGMRLYLNGGLAVLDPAATVLHHHAASGGLRWHGVRVVTYSSSRTKLLHRNLPAPSEILLAKRYFTPRQVRESLCLRALGTLSLRGSCLMRWVKMVTGLVLLPVTWSTMRSRERTVDEAARHSIDPPLSFRSRT
jgi:glycosyltransferase involved in cell wall biosynthesis